MDDDSEPDILIVDAIVSARLSGISNARDAADQALGPITDEMWSKMREHWEWHWSLPDTTLQTVLSNLFK